MGTPVLLVADAAVVASVFRDLNHVRHPFKLYLRPRSVHASVYPHVPFKELDAIQLRGSFYRSRTPTLLLQEREPIDLTALPKTWSLEMLRIH